MLQNEQEYIRILKARLEGTLPRDEALMRSSPIIPSTSVSAKANGRSEEELFRSLGSPDDVAREIRATHLVKKAERRTRSCRNLFHAVLATTRPRALQPGLCTRAVHPPRHTALRDLHPRVMITFFGFVGVVYSLLQIIGVSTFSVWHSPFAGVFFATGMTTTVLVIIGNLRPSVLLPRVHPVP